jgi:hypothetical protein
MKPPDVQGVYIYRSDMRAPQRLVKIIVRIGG